jgi:uncharacterized protein
MHALPPEFRGAGGAVGVWWAFIHPIAAAAVAVGYAGVIATLVERGKLPMTRWFAAVGSMSLTAYLLQSIVLASIFRWWGLGWFGTVGQSMAIVIGVTVYGVVLVASLLWNRHFLLGPCEWLWRWFTYLQRPPIRRHAQSSTPQSTIDLQR